MSSEENEDDLEERKGEIWSMDEVRSGGGAATTDTGDGTASKDTSDTSNPDNNSDPSDSSDIDDTVDEELDSIKSEAKDISDTSDRSNSPDGEDTPREDQEDPILEAEGDTVRQMALDAEDKGLTVRDLHNVNVYLFESVYHDMRTKFKELDTEYYAAHGEDLSKNKDFFNAVFRAGLQSPQLKEELEIE